MFTIKKILVPTDFSENASSAYPMAQEISRKYSATIDLIHIIPTLQYFHESMATLNIPLNLEKNVYPKVQQKAAGILDNLMTTHIDEAHRGNRIVTIARKPAVEIIKQAKKGGHDLIVMASQGEHESELLRGSTTEKVIRLAATPVLSTQRPNTDEINNILVPADGSETSFKAFPMAISLALTFGARLTLYHVQELYGSFIETSGDPRKSDTEQIKDKLLSELEKFFTSSWDDVEIRRGDGFNHQLVYNEGPSNATIDLEIAIGRAVSAHHAITDYAAGHADMVVMNTHGRSGLSHLLLGSTAEKVAQYLDLPVVTVKPDFDEPK